MILCYEKHIAVVIIYNFCCLQLENKRFHEELLAGIREHERQEKNEMAICNQHETRTACE
ncbi:hypothetical protein DPMN_053184 [Dreissena polymorpha]|uniref:Uncharacterized protein n=1 Tax=Dreissena polymorpha TaxID=45954 RepID=A0A9D4HQ02_DREPO|nr:hypothetical protein DPMN_053184 [Dreissena polymorpha]